MEQQVAATEGHEEGLPNQRIRAADDAQAADGERGRGGRGRSQGGRGRGRGGRGRGRGRGRGGRPRGRPILSETEVVVLRVPIDTEDVEVAKLLATAGELESVSGRETRQATSRVVFATFRTSEAVDEAVKLSMTEINGSEVRIRRRIVGREQPETVPGDPCAIFVGKLNESVRDDAVKQEFAKYGNIDDYLRSRNEFFALIKFDNAQSAQQALQSNDQDLGSGPIVVREDRRRVDAPAPAPAPASAPAPVPAEGNNASPKQQRKKTNRKKGKKAAAPAAPAAAPVEGVEGEAAPAKKPRKKRPRRRSPKVVFVGGFPEGYERKEAGTVFEDVVKIRLRRHPQTAFLTFGSAESAQKAIERNGEKIFGDEPLRIELAR